MNEKEKIEIFLVDDHKLLRNTLRMFLESHKHLDIVGEAGCGMDALKRALKLKPQIVLMDITLPDCDGIEITKQIIKELPDTKIIAVTMHPEKLYLLKFLEAGGVGYIHKSAADQDLLQAIERVLLGEIFLSQEGIQVMAGQFMSQNVEEETEEKNREITPDILSKRERQVLGLLSRGYTCREIGERLFLATSTVETYKRRVDEKLNLTNRRDLVEYAIRYKLFED